MRVRAAVAAVALATVALARAADPAPAEGAAPASSFAWEDVAEVLAIGDAHGSFDPVVRLLSRLGLIDEQRLWTGGQAHLVMVGDILDRGAGERALLDLLRDLERQARRAGGAVHVLLGNHEVFALVRDLRYVSPEAYAGWAGLERREDRERAWDRFREAERVVSAGDERRLREVFDAAHPKGYFGRIRALEAGGEYGDWLLERPAMIRINGTVFVHGGLTEEVAALGLDGVNEGVRRSLIDYRAAREVLERAGRIDPQDNFQRAMQTAAAVASGDKDETVRAAAARMRSFVESLAGSIDGPLWYRGLSLEDERLERRRVADVLAALGAERLVLGHSITGGGTITSRFEGRILRVDVGLVHGSAPQALFLAGRTARVFDLESGALTAPLAEHPAGEGWQDDFGEFTDLRLERFLESAPIAESRDLGRGSTRPVLVVLARDGIRKRAVLKTVDRPAADGGPADRWRHEVAAYRLDRLLDLDLVPVTVERDAGELGRGSLQWWVSGAIDAYAVHRYGLEREVETPVAGELARIRLFDALIGNGDRTDTDILHVPRATRVLAIDHSKAFTLETDVARFLGDGPCTADFGFLFALRGLSERDVRRQLSPWLDAEQIAALLVRREALLARCEAPDAP